MPAGRRIPRGPRNPLPIGLSYVSSSDFGNCRYGYTTLGIPLPTLPGLETPPPPKHFPFPNIATESDLTFEFGMFIFTAVATELQFLHMYKTVWWLPHSYNNQAVHFYLIDHNLMMFITILLSRKVLYILGCKLIQLLVAPKMHDLGFMAFRLFLFGVMISALGWCSFFVIQNNPVVNIFYLCYPILVYIILFGMKISPFFETVNWSSLSAPPPMHACTSNAAEIRTEVENLKTNFNNRMKQILFCSILNAYYAAFIPCCFAQSFVYYCAYWASQHVIFVFLSCFAACTVHHLPLRYCDTLHRSTLHLGRWEKVDIPPSQIRPVPLPLPAAHGWCDRTLFAYGTLVRHGRDLYRAYGDSNAAEPGNGVYTRFYAIFKNPSSALGGVLAIHLFIVLFQLVLLVRSTYWYHMISVGIVMFYNYYILFKLGRDYFVSVKIYRAEQALHERPNLKS